MGRSETPGISKEITAEGNALNEGLGESPVGWPRSLSETSEWQLVLGVERDSWAFRSELAAGSQRTDGGRYTHGTEHRAIPALVSQGHLQQSHLRVQAAIPPWS